MILLARLPSNCSVRPNRGLSIRNDGSHSIAPVNHSGSVSITQPALHSRDPSTPIAPLDPPRQAVPARKSATKILGCAPKSPQRSFHRRVPHPPRFRALALFRRRPHQRVASWAPPACENLTKSRHHRSLSTTLKVGHNSPRFAA
jgi:hypothetical protein